MSNNTNYTSYFKSGYEECRAAFLKSVELLKDKYDVSCESLKVSSKTESGLFIDAVQVKTSQSQNNEKLAVISSGVHGLEGITGSAFQNIMIEQIVEGEKYKGFDFLFLHTVNPWGLKNRRRVNENNVDLNRNFGLTDDLFTIKNKPYAGLDSLLNPKKKLSRNFLSALILILKVIFKVVTKSKRYLVEAIGVGQYEFEKGIIFGGFEFQQEKELLQPLIENIVSEYKTIVAIDLHTGLGARGDISLLNAPKSNEKIKEYTNRIFNGNMVSDDDDDWYDEHGSFLDFISSLCSNGQLCIPVMFEFGTTDSQTLRESLRIIVNLRDENQGFHHGYKAKKDYKSIRQAVEEAITPSCLKWRQDVSLKFVENILLIENVNKII